MENKELTSAINSMASKIDKMDAKVNNIEREIIGSKDYSNPGIVQRLNDHEARHISIDMRIAGNFKNLDDRIDAIEKSNEKWDFKKGVYIWIGGAVIGTGTWIASHPFIMKFLMFLGLVKQMP